jgi:putative endonuclease
MFTVYVLYSQKFDKIYIGYTSDLANRFLSHNELATKGHTVKYRPWVIAHSEEFEMKAEARKRETQLKTGRSREFV